MTAERRSLPHTLRRALTSVPALVYLAVCVGLTVWAAVVTAGDSTGESMAGVIPMLATLPLSLAVLALPLPEGPWAFLLPLLVCALVNAVFIGWCVRTLTERSVSRSGNRA
ncbi:SCO4225 family membrane protein [Streptomyces cacaoi]|uniref:SCO4225 family membrane protein n=1 Tax=Streptomyces cacaoi TaxID=1898 RepID=UPI002611477B|nr:hypothetical protein [Streptomyces cacaoi]